MTRLLLIGVSFAAFATAVSQAAVAAEDKQGGIEEIVVTAQRREESVQKAALAIQAISSAELARGGIARPEDLSRVATGVQIGSGGAMPQVYVRGVGNYSTNNYAEGAVAINADGVYISRGWATRGAFFDLDRVEVLKGPQGTLYGRNASGGAINLITARPTFDKIGGYVEGEVGNFSLGRGAAAINVPINDVLAIRASGQVTHRDGYDDDGYMDDKSEAGRLHVLYKPSSDFSLLLTGGYQHQGGKGTGETPEPTITGTSPWLGLSSPQFNQIFTSFASFVGFPPFASIIAMGKDGFIKTDVYNISGELNWNLGWATLTVIPSYRSGTYAQRAYVSSFQVNYDEFDHQTSVETRLSNQNEHLKWVFGGYYFDEHQGNNTGKNIAYEDGGFLFGESQGPFKSRTTSAAGFGQATYSIVPSFRLTAGLRYTYEHKKQSGIDTHYTFAPFPAACPGVYDNTLTQLHCGFSREFGGDLTFYNVSFKAGFEYDLGPRSMLYANYSTGFKSGGFVYATSPTYKPERLNAWELGVKNRFLNNRLQANIEAFYWRYINHQEAHLGFIDTGALSFIVENAGVAESYGLLADLVYEPTRNDKFTLGVQWNPSKYKDFKYTYPTGAANGQPPFTSCPVGPLSAVGPTGTQTVDCAGQPVVRAPIWSGNAGYEHDFDLRNGATVTANVDAQFATGSYLGIEFLHAERQQAYYMLNSALTYTAPDGRWSVSAWGRNLTNAAVFTDAFPSPFVPNAVGGSIRPPRTYGIRGRLNF